MSTCIRAALTTALLLVTSRAAAAQSITTTGVLGTMTVTTAVAGSQPTPVSNSATKYTLTTKKNKGITRVTAQLDVPLPAGVTFTINMPAPAASTIVSAGGVSLSTAPQNVLTNLPNSSTTFAATTITYTLSTTVGAGVVPSTAYKVTFTLQ